MTKSDNLDGMHADFLKNLCISISSNPYKESRNLTKEDCVGKIGNRLSESQIMDILDLYSSGVPAELVGDKISPDGENIILQKLEGYFQGEGFQQVKVGKRRCDFVVPEAMIAVEVKSELDDLRKAEEQMFDYDNWADVVYLAYDETHTNSIPNSIKENGFGLLEYNGHLREVRKPKRSPAETRNLLEYMTGTALDEMLGYYGIQKSGNKSDKVDRLVKSLSTHDIRYWFMRFLSHRSNVLDN